MTEPSDERQMIDKGLEWLAFKAGARFPLAPGEDPENCIVDYEHFDYTVFADLIRSELMKEHNLFTKTIRVGKIICFTDSHILHDKHSDMKVVAPPNTVISLNDIIAYEPTFYTHKEPIYGEYRYIHTHASAL